MAELVIPVYLVSLIFGLVAFFYSSVGFGDGPPYPALLAVFGLTSAAIPMIYLSMNLLLTAIGSFVFFQNRYSSIKLLAPFLVSSTPMANVGRALRAYTRSVRFVPRTMERIFGSIPVVAIVVLGNNIVNVYG